MIDLFLWTVTVCACVVISILTTTLVLDLVDDVRRKFFR